MRAQRLEAVMQFVSDTERSRDWYARLLGVEPVPFMSPYFPFGDGAYLILAPSAPGTGRGGTAVMFGVADVDEAHRELTALGFTFNEEPFDVPPGRYVTLNDPDGNIVGLIDNSKGGMAAVSGTNAVMA